MPQSLTWRARGGASVRAHTAISYDIGGLRTSENVSVIQPPGAVGVDTGGLASYDYDLADRLTRYTSPYKDAPTDVAKPTTTYTLDDGANITNQTTTVGSETRADETSTYPNGRLATRHTTGAGSTPAEDTTYGYSPLGEETDRTTTGGDPKARGSAYDPAGHTGAVDDRSAPTAADVDYAYDGSDNLISRKESAGGGGAKTKLYFYWGMGTTLAEETDGRGATLVRYLVDGGDTVAQETYRVSADGHRDPTDTAGTWTWLLDDPSGNVATHVGDDGAVTKQLAFDPYGRPEKGGTGKTPTAPGSSLGFQGDHTDPTTGSVILGPRQYDPTTARFTSPDVYAAGDLDLGLGTDELTGNRYLFAAANPVAYYDDGHKPGLCRRFWNCKKGSEGDQKAEADVCVLDLGPIACPIAYNYHIWAVRMAKKYGRNIPGEINAIQHALWAAIMTWDFSIGERGASRLLEAHEVGTPYPNDHASDLKNNSIGIAIGNSERRLQFTWTAMQSILKETMLALGGRSRFGTLDLTGGLLE